MYFFLKKKIKVKRGSLEEKKIRNGSFFLILFKYFSLRDAFKLNQSEKHGKTELNKIFCLVLTHSDINI